jgi:hypothetical protein
MDMVNKYLTTPLKVIAVIVFLVFTTLEYSKVVFSGDGSFKKANENTLKRFLGVLLLFFAPDIINAVLKWAEISSCKL